MSLEIPSPLGREDEAEPMESGELQLKCMVHCTASHVDEENVEAPYWGLARGIQGIADTKILSLQEFLYPIV